MVVFGASPCRDDASCCSVEVISGFGGLLTLTVSLTERTVAALKSLTVSNAVMASGSVAISCIAVASNPAAKEPTRRQNAEAV
jgi:hypothetical protein